MSPSATPQTRDADDAGKIYSPSLRICWKKIPNHDGTRLGFAPDSPQEGGGFEPSVPRDAMIVQVDKFSGANRAFTLRQPARSGSNRYS
jgi:hypothetical protein